MAILNPFAFVLMPFSKGFDDIYKLGIQSIATELGVVAERVDEQTFSETILERIYRQIDVADFIIADMTGKNPNVFYEVGYAHARGKPCTLLTQKQDDIPFDLRHHRHLIYGGSIQRLQQQLRGEISWLKGEIIKRRTETINVELKSIEGILVKKEWYATGEIQILLDMRNQTDRRTPEIEAMYLHTGPGWRFEQGSDECESTQSDIEKATLRHFIKSPVVRISPGAWAPIKIKGRKTLWFKTKGDAPKDEYTIAGYVVLEVVTSEGVFRKQIDLEVVVSEFPF